MVYTSITTSLGGTFDNNLYLTCAVSALLTAFAHFSLYQKTPRDFRSPRLGEENTIYELSTIYLLPFSWLLFRINPLFPETLAAADIPMAALLTAVVVYGCAGAVVGKYFLPSADGSRPLASFLQPADAAYVRQCQLLLSGNAAINVLALLFVPFTWTLVIRGTEWWARVCSLHPNQAAFLGLSVLAAIVGDSSGVVALRLLRKDVITSTAAVVVLGLVSNALLLIVPEVVFRIFYAQGVSELNFYWQ
ncbi:hypothetical protein B484DRAFT_455068 [Ochromonadaceae sp. CCMP2298]|nr:hypothetical protein B484DRAFT_455068 [Ochromonadaceae sp. CCMP2298]